MTAAMLPVMVGFVGLAADVGAWYVQKARLQIATDAAAIGGTIALSGDGSDAEVTEAANQDAALNGFAPGDAELVLDIDRANNMVSARMTAPAKVVFSALFLNSGFGVTTRAAAALSPPPVCLLALRGSGTAISLGGNSAVSAPDCMVYSDSAAANGISAGGSSSIESLSTCSVGSYSGSGDHYSPLPKTGCPIKADPFSQLAEPAIGACGSSDLVLNGGSTPLDHGVYCGGITIRGNSRVTFAPGLYIIKDGPLSVAGNAVVSGAGVTFYLTGPGAVLDITGGSSIELSAPTTGTYAGVLIFQDRDSTGLTNVLTGGSDLDLDGAVYLPTNRLSITGSSSSAMSRLTSVVVDTFAMTGAGAIRFDPESGGNQSRNSVVLVQ